MTQTQTVQVANGAQQQEVVMGFGSAQGFALMQRAANLLAASTLVPQEYQGNISNCVIALNMANRMQADPLMVMQNLVVVHGKPTWSSQFAIATVNSCGRFTALRYEWVGKEGDDGWGCRAWATEKSTGEKLVGSTVTIALAKAEGWYQRKGSKWQTMPQQMLMYRAASWFTRAYAPELMMGLHTADEIHDIVELSDDDYEVQEVGANANKGVIDVKPEMDGPIDSKTDAPAKDKGGDVPEQPGGGKPAQATIGGPGF